MEADTTDKRPMMSTTSWKCSGRMPSIWWRTSLRGTGHSFSQAECNWNMNGSYKSLQILLLKAKIFLQDYLQAVAFITCLLDNNHKKKRYLPLVKHFKTSKLDYYKLYTEKSGVPYFILKLHRENIFASDHLFQELAHTTYKNYKNETEILNIIPSYHLNFQQGFDRQNEM